MTTTHRQHGPMLLPPLQDPLVVPALSESTPGLIHLVTLAQFGGEPYAFCTGSLRPATGPHCGPNCIHIQQVCLEHHIDPPEPSDDDKGFVECERCRGAVAVDALDDNGRCERCASETRDPDTEDDC